MRTQWRTWIIVAFGAVLCLPPASAQSFTGIGAVMPSAVSADGKVVAGSTGASLYLWTFERGWEDIGTPHGYPPQGGGKLSGDGSIMAYGASRWTRQGGYEDLPRPPGSYTYANSISADGQVIVGSIDSDAARWSPAGVERFQIGRHLTWASASSYDGSIVAVNAFGDGTDILAQAHLWTLSGLEPLGFLPGGVVSEANDVSLNGRVVVGSAGDENAIIQAIRWTEETGMRPLGLLPGMDNSVATATNADGSVVVGSCGDNVGGSPDKMFVWDTVHGMRDLKDVLTASGADVAGWELRNITDVSADGRTIVGWGVGPDWRLEGYVAVLPPIPEPPDLIPIGTTIAWLVIRKRRSKN